MVQDYDEPILKHLTDIQLKFHDQPMGFTLEFMFTENEYFTNKTLTKYYEMKCAPDKDDPFSFEGPEIFKCKVRILVLLKIACFHVFCKNDKFFFHRSNSRGNERAQNVSMSENHDTCI